MTKARKKEKNLELLSHRAHRGHREKNYSRKNVPLVHEIECSFECSSSEVSVCSVAKISGIPDGHLFDLSDNVFDRFGQFRGKFMEIGGADTIQQSVIHRGKAFP